ncbi:hypothetical protein ACNFJN_15055 [Xenorhabdus budapestensis]|uniref:hypothetical protein n=1 Tax=Xenorhabdus budapestensis TaxID=290110 RepID=UPI003A8770D6
MRLRNLHRHQTDDICFQRCADVPHRGVLPCRLQECCCRCPKVILTSDRIMDKSDYANKQKSSGQWVIHFPGQKIMSGARRNFWASERGCQYAVTHSGRLV